MWIDSASECNKVNFLLKGEHIFYSAYWYAHTISVPSNPKLYWN